MREIHVFDVDGTLVDSKKATIEAYELAAPGVFQPKFWGLPASAWGCTQEIHERKIAEFKRMEHLIKPAWAMPMFYHADMVGHRIILLTGASEMTMAIHKNKFRAFCGHQCHCGLTTEGKADFMRKLAQDNPKASIHYYDDAAWPVVESILNDLNVTAHRPMDLPDSPRVVVLAAGLGSRFGATGTPKPLLTYQGVPMIDRAVLMAQEVDAHPICIVSTLIEDEIRGEHTVPVSRTQRGPAESALLAGAHIRHNDPVIFLDCDTCLSPGTIYNFASRAHDVETEAAVLVADRGDNVGSYGTINRLSGGCHVFEEAGSSGNCLVGAYYIRSWHLFKRAHAMAYLQTPLSKEIKLSTVLSRMEVRPIITDTINWTPLGTPEELSHANQRAV
jgi:GTP:adenosylcobinamide-phosphate guanylyltransferase